MRIPPWYGLLYPLGALIALYIGARSTWRAGAGWSGEGRAYTAVRATSGRLESVRSAAVHHARPAWESAAQHASLRIHPETELHVADREGQ